MQRTEIELAENIVLEVLYKVLAEIKPKPRVCGNLHHFSRTAEAGDEARSRKKEHTKLEQAMRASLVDEEMHQRRVQEASNSMHMSGAKSTTNGVEIDVYGITDTVILIDVGTIDGDPMADPASSGKPNPLAC